MKNEPFTIHDFPESEKPRERLIKFGPSSLSNSELIAILLRTGVQNQNVLDLSKKILKQHSFASLSETSVGELQKIRGIGKAKACQLIACFELSKRISSFSGRKNLIVKSAEDIANYLMPKMRFLKKEHFIVFYLDSKNKVIKEETISIGTLNASIIHPREIFKSAIKESANAIILVHNHPTGNPEPSEADQKLTKKIEEASELIKISLLDHIIIGNNKWFSFEEKNLI